MSIFLWWLAVTLIGVAFMPFSNSLFHGFKDGGWLFSKAAGIFISGWLLWVLNVLHVLSFVQKNCILAVLVCFLLNLLYLYFVFFRKKKSFLDGISLPLINLSFMKIREQAFLLKNDSFRCAVRTHKTSSVLLD